jgi:hypothetical protein
VIHGQEAINVARAVLTRTTKFWKSQSETFVASKGYPVLISEMSCEIQAIKIGLLQVPESRCGHGVRWVSPG